MLRSDWRDHRCGTSRCEQWRRGFAFPDNTPVAQGDTVEWINKMGMDHTVTADEGEFDSGPFGEDETFSYQFDTAGAFAYHCNIHRRMKGKVTVT
jgi:plastocyanin